MSLHSRATGSSLHEDKRYKRDVRACATTAVSTSSPGSTVDGVTLTNGDRVLLTAQSTAAQNGIYTWNGASSNMTRSTDADEASDFTPGFFVYVREGTLHNRSVFVFTTITAVSVDVTDLTFQSINTIGPLGPTGNQGEIGPSGAKGPQGIAAAEFDPPYVLIQDQKSSGTSGHHFFSGGINTLDLTTVLSDAHGLSFLSSNQVALAAGQYRTSATAPVDILSSGAFKLRIQNVTDATTLVVGATESRGGTFDGTTSRTFLSGRFTLISPKVVEVQMQSTNGFQAGRPTSLGDVEVYTIVEFWRVADEPPIGMQFTQLPARVRRGAMQIDRTSANTTLPV